MVSRTQIWLVAIVMAISAVVTTMTIVKDYNNGAYKTPKINL